MTIRLSALASACALVSCSIGLARADQAQLGHVVVTATRQPLSASDVLANVDVIDRDEIRRAGQSSLVQLLAARSGIQMVSNGGAGSSSSVFLRGADSGHTLLLIDGMRVGSVTNGSPVLENIPLELVERIEILRGPASALYGADAIGGVIQVFTRQGREGFQPSLRIGAGSEGAQSVAATLAGGEDRLRYSLAVGQDSADGINSKPDSREGRDRDEDGFRNLHFSGSLSLRLRENDELGVNVFHSGVRNWYDSGNAFDAYLDKRTESAGIYLRNRPSQDWTSTLRLGYSSDISRDHDDFRSQSEFNSYQTQFSWQNDVALAGGLLLAGYEFLHQRVDTSTEYSRTGRRVNSLLLGWGGEFGAHQVQLNARHDDNSDFGGKTTGTAAYGYQFAPEWRVRGSVGTAFKAPTFNDLYYPLQCYDLWGCFGGNPDLKPEEALNREVGVVWERKDARFSATYFNNRIRNLIDWSSGIADNVASARTEGVELAASTMLWGYRLRASVDFLKARDQDSGDDLARRAHETATLAIERSVGPWDWGVEWNGRGTRYDRLPNTDAGRMGGYGLLNAYAHYALARDWSVELRANNVLDKRYELARYTYGSVLRPYGTQGADFFVALRYAMH